MAIRASTVVDEYFIYVVGGFGQYTGIYGTSPYIQIMDTRTEQWNGQAASSPCKLDILFISELLKNYSEFF